ncbi:predicted protein [Micromonas commoda]|uniref:Uncharacterized protein n=1 Tax=Micromonas commoda (strain RCC299 / NOUM17 / CCMP2709) TaxID=296587 RepID=C1EJQ5_MICCC|nr:predicted protein [Micromonas commoda]ACO68231.1 predicted protein [Micromonas commoda]|eukprot:XP_002506973.1 predicted protein [Micromonas commoda]
MTVATDDLRAFIDLDGTPSTPSDDIDDSDSDCSWEVPESIDVDEQMCEGCGGGGETRPGMTDAETLLCDGDGCERTWYIACLGPPLTALNLNHACHESGCLRALFCFCGVAVGLGGV